MYVLKTADGEEQILVDRELVMGRDASCDLVLDKGQASRQHARLIPDGEGLWVEDLGSTNGTWVNDERIEGRRLLAAGDQLRGGASRFVVQLAGEAVQAGSDSTLVDAADATLKEGEASPVVSEAPVAASEAVAAKDEARAGGDSPKAPPSWVLNNQQSVDGTAFISREQMRDSLANSGTNFAVADEVLEPTLIGNSDPVMGLRFQLIGDGKHKWEIGRSPQADVMLNHDSVSGSHAQILHEKGRWKLVDLMSANGSYVNGKKCLTGYLASGDSIRLGTVDCLFTLPAGAEVATAEAEDEQSEAGNPAIKTALIAFGATAVLIGIAAAVIAML